MPIKSTELLISAKPNYVLITAIRTRSDPLRIKFSGLDLGQYCLGALEEGLFDAVARLGARFKEYEVVFLSEPARLHESDFPLLLQVLLVPHEKDDDGRAGQGPSVSQPIGERIEGLSGGDIVD